MTDHYFELRELAAIPGFQTVPEDQLQWLIDAGSLLEMEQGDILFRFGEPILNTLIILQGQIRLFIHKGNKIRELTVFRENAITGYLPYTRGIKAVGNAECLTKCRIFTCPAEKIKEGTKLHYELTEALVHAMNSRIRDLTFLQQQNEKMFALGKLSAGLAHELNNPASAIARDAANLKQQVIMLPSLVKQLITANIEPACLTKINNLLTDKLGEHAKGHWLNMMERSDKEDNINNWLLSKKLEINDIPESFAEFSISPADLDGLSEILTSAQLSATLAWINSLLQSGKMSADISESSVRISQLVNSVKSFTHMDRDLDKQPTDIHTGIRNTLVMLNHKIKKGNIQIIEDFDLSIPLVNALAGELNQIWTNIIDNAVDAMDTNSTGTLTIKTQRDKQFACVYITDTGPGIPADVRSQIFDPFFTTKEIGKGTGLGLDLLSHILKQHNGTIKVSSEPGNTQFIICFPITAS